MSAQPVAYPVSVDLDAPLEIARWRPLVHWLLAIPQLLISQALQTLRYVLTLISFFTIIFTKKIPRSLFDVIVMTMRYQWRTSSFMFFMREAYPPFDFQPASQDTGTDPAKFSIEYPEELGRFMPLVKWFLAIPHYFVIMLLFIPVVLGGFAAFFAVLITGRYPEGIRNFQVGFSRWTSRVTAYVGLLTDRYPPFSLS
jgi:hypothetical protein